MKMVAASRLRRAQEAAEAARPYAERMERMIGSILDNMGSVENAPKLLAGTGADDTHMLVAVTSDRGLCGGFNSSIVRETRKRIIQLQADGKTVRIMCIGKKARDLLRRDYGAQIVDTYEGIGKTKDTFAEVKAIGDRLIAMYGNGQFDVCTIVYNKFVSVITQIVTPQQIIPVEVPEKDDGEEKEQVQTPGAIYEYEPSEEEILADLLPANLNIQVFRAVLESSASEHGARMSAMDNATRNAGEMIDDLSLIYNRTRQAKITSELIEIISGAEAV